MSSQDSTNGKGEEQKETPQQKYLLEEMKLLRGEVELRGQEQRNMEKYVLLATAAILAFVFGKEHSYADEFKRLAAYAWYVPPVLAAFAYFRWYESVRMIDRLARYIAQIEKLFLNDRGGWETFLVEQRWKGRSPMAPYPYVALWILLFPGTLALAAWFSPLPVPPPPPAPSKPYISEVLFWLSLVVAAAIFLHLWKMQRDWRGTHPNPNPSLGGEPPAGVPRDRQRR